MYLALYRKWRPKTFEDVISQPHITITLKNEIINNQTAHAYLFTGPRGTGKTTCSKILSMAVNCINPIDGNPCMECESCIGIDEGSILDVVEIDAASNNGVDNIRQLRDEANYTPTQCKYRVYIIDEAHMLSTGAFNALLKIMEEPPSHVLFILATTEAHKIPATILSRCQRFDFRRIKSDDIKDALLNIALKENSFELDEDAALLIARLADGGMRDALSLLDQCIAYSNNVTKQIVIDATGIVSNDYLYEITDYIVSKDAASAVLLLDKLYSLSKDLQGLLEELINHFRNIMLTKTLKDSKDLISALPEEFEIIKEYSQKINLSSIIYIISQLQECLDKMGKSIDRKLCLELYLIKLCTPSLNTNNDALIARIDKLENFINNKVSINNLNVNNEISIDKSTQSSITKDNMIGINDNDTNIKKTLKANDIDISLNQIEQKPIKSDNTKTKQNKVTTITPLMEWAEILDEIKKKDMPLWGVLHSSKAYVSNQFLYIESPLEFAAGMMRQEGNAIKLVTAVFEKTGVRYKLRIKSNKQIKNEPKINMLDEVLDKAKSLGVEVHEQ